MAATKYRLEDIAALAKRRGFVYPSSEIYGGMANSYDYGPYGVELKENVRKIWWKRYIQDREEIYGIDASIIINPKVWEASGHTTGFADVMVEDKVNHKRYRADHIIEEWFEKKGKEVKVDGKSAEEMAEIITENKIKSPDGNALSEPKRFNQLFKTEVGIIEGDKNEVYLRGEIAQGIFINFKNIIDSIHPTLPFGIGQTGKAFRNEITKGKFTFRTLEFDLMEFEYFFDSATQKWEELFESWKKDIEQFAKDVGVREERLRWRAHEEFELAFYSSRTEDLEYEFPWGYKEMFACAYRTDYDLSNHEKHSGKELKYLTPEGKKLSPHVIEPTFGLSRLVTILLIDAYEEEEIEGRKRVYLKFDPKVAPVKAAIFPLTKDEKLTTIAQEIYKDLKLKYNVEYDLSGSIGKRYRRQDEIGTPFCITVDFDTLDDKSVTIRDRDTLKQERVPIEKLSELIAIKVS